MLVHSHVQTGPGALMDAPPWFVLSSNASMEEIGEHVQIALASTVSGKTERPQQGSMLAHKYKLLGVTSEDELKQNAQYVSLRCNEQSIFITPTENGLLLWHRNFRLLTEQTFHIPRDADDRAIGEAIWSGLLQCA